MDARAGAGLVDDVDGLVGQEAVLHVAGGERDGGLDGLVSVTHVVVLLVALLQAADDGQRVLGRGLADVDRLEAALEGGVLLDVLAVLLGGGGPDDLDFSAREGRLQDGGGVDGAFGGARTNDGVDLVDEEDVILGALELLDDLLHTLLELSAVLGASHEGGQVKGPDLLAAQDVGHVAGGYELGQALDDGGLAHARVPQDEWVVLLAAGQDLHDALNLSVTADDRVELAVGGHLGEVAAVLLKHGGVVGGGRLGLAAAHAHEDGAGGLALGRLLVGLVCGELVDGVADGVARDAHGAQGVHGATVALGHDAQQQVLGGYVVLAMGHGLAVGVLQHALGARREGDMATGDRLGLALGEALDGGEGLVVGDLELGQRLCGNALPLADEGQKQVLRADVHLAEVSGLVLGKAHDLAGLVCELLEHVGGSLSCKPRGRGRVCNVSVYPPHRVGKPATPDGNGRGGTGLPARSASRLAPGFALTRQKRPGPECRIGPSGL